MTLSQELIPLLAAFVAVPAFAAQSDPHHTDVQSSAPAAAAATPPAKADADHGCPMAGGHMMAGQGHMSGDGGMHCGPAHHSAKGSMHHGARHHGRHHAAPKPAK